MQALLALVCKVIQLSAPQHRELLPLLLLLLLLLLLQVGAAVVEFTMGGRSARSE
jgi:hypothetical protein